MTELQHPDSAFYIFAPEDSTLGQGVIDAADAVVYVPTIGSLNLAAVVNVVLYDRMAKSAMTFANNELIRRSRDKTLPVIADPHGAARPEASVIGLTTA